MQIQGKNLQIVNSYAEIAYFMQKKSSVMPMPPLSSRRYFDDLPRS